MVQKPIDGDSLSLRYEMTQIALGAYATQLDCQECDEHGAAKLAGVTVSTIRNWRRRRVHLRFYKRGAKVFYRVADCLAFRESGRVEPVQLDGAQK